MDEYITIALPKGKLFDKSVRLLGKVGYSAENVTEDSRKLVISNEETKVRLLSPKLWTCPPMWSMALQILVSLVRMCCWSRTRTWWSFWIWALVAAG